jgi:hypothetical protein
MHVITALTRELRALCDALKHKHTRTRKRMHSVLPRTSSAEDMRSTKPASTSTQTTKAKKDGENTAVDSERINSQVKSLLGNSPSLPISFGFVCLVHVCTFDINPVHLAHSRVHFCVVGSIEEHVRSALSQLSQMESTECEDTLNQTHAVSVLADANDADVNEDVDEDANEDENEAGKTQHTTTHTTTASTCIDTLRTNLYNSRLEAHMYAHEYAKEHSSSMTRLTEVRMRGMARHVSDLIHMTGLICFA